MLIFERPAFVINYDAAIMNLPASSRHNDSFKLGYFYSSSVLKLVAGNTVIGPDVVIV